MKLRNTIALTLPLTILSACGGGGGGHSAANPGVAPSGLAYSENFSVYMVDASHAALTASVTGTVTQWSVTPALPAGLALNPTTGAIAGTPHASALRGTYVIRAANSAGHTETTIQLSVEKPERYAYVTSTNDRTVSIFALDSSNGNPTRRGFVVGQAWQGHPEEFVPHVSGRFAYSSTGEGVLTTWTLAANSGWPTELDALAVDFGPHSLDFSPEGHFLFLAQQNGNEVTTFAVDPGNGLLTQTGPSLAVAPQPVALDVDPTGKLMAVASQGDAGSGVGSMLTLLSINPNDGTLLQFGPGLLLNGAQPSSCVFSPRQNVIYVAMPSTSRVVAIAFDPATGDMQSLGGFFSGTGCNSLVCDPLGGHLWAVNQGTGTLTTFAIQPNGSIVGAGTLGVGTSPLGTALDPLGRFVFTIDSVTQELGLYDLDGTSGAPAHRTGCLTRGGPAHIAFGAGEHALISKDFELLSTAFDSSELVAHTVDATSGLLGAGVSLPTSAGPLHVSVDPLQRFAFTANVQDHSIGRYRIDPATGALSELLPKLSTSGIPISIDADASGRFLYVATRGVADPNDGFVSTFGIDGTSGALTLLGTVSAGFAPNWLGTDPTGQFLYIANTGTGATGSATIQVFRLAAQTGLPTGSSVSQATAGVWTLGFHPSGRYLYAALHNSNSTVPFQISQTDGSITALDGGVQSTLEPMSVALTPDGRWAYVASHNGAGAGTVTLYEVEQTSGKLLMPGSPFVDGNTPLEMCMSTSGQFLYTANSGTDSISSFGIQSADGFLAPLASTPAGLAPSSLALLQRWQ